KPVRGEQWGSSLGVLVELADMQPLPYHGAAVSGFAVGNAEEVPGVCLLALAELLVRERLFE
ncbi:MAG: hypothetical protein GX537_08810, partial [Actinobacteria bacterium]|nr:hypothetical protein [Actinomycetota bacterium]